MRLSSYVHRTFIFPISMTVRSAWFKNNVGCLNLHKGPLVAGKETREIVGLKKTHTLLAKLGSSLQ